MKTTTLILGLLVSYLYATAQQNPKRNHFLQPGFDTEVLSSAKMANGKHLIVGKAGNYVLFGSEAIRLFCFDSKGALLWEKDGQIGAERIGDAVITPLPGDYFVLLTSPSGCDFGMPKLWAFYGPNGALLWSGQDYLDNKLSLPVLPYDQNTFLIYSPDIAGFIQFQYSPQGLELVNTVANIPDYGQGYLQLPSGDFVLPLGNKTLRQCGNGLTPKKDISFAHQILDYESLSGGRMAVLFSDSLVVLDTSWLAERTVLLPNKGMELSATNGRIFLTANYNGIKKLTILDSVFQTTGALEIPKELPLPHIGSSDSSLFLFGTSRVEKQNNALLFKTLPVNDLSFETAADLSVVDILFHDSIRYHPINWGPALMQATDFGKVSVTVRNNGNKPVENYFLKFRTYYCPGICAGEINISHRETGKDLLPGEEETVTFSSNLIFSCSFPISELCIWVNGPNEAPDELPDNNRFCKNFIALLGNNDPFQHTGLRLFPNPSSGVIALPDFPDPADFQVFNVTGKLVLTGRTESGMLNCSELPDGLYQLVVRENSGKNYIGRFVLVK